MKSDNRVIDLNTLFNILDSLLKEMFKTSGPISESAIYALLQFTLDLMSSFQLFTPLRTEGRTDGLYLEMQSLCNS